MECSWVEIKCTHMVAEMAHKYMEEHGTTKVTLMYIWYQPIIGNMVGLAGTICAITNIMYIWYQPIMGKMVGLAGTISVITYIMYIWYWLIMGKMIGLTGTRLLRSMALRRDVRKGFWCSGMGRPSDCEGTPGGTNYVAWSRDRVSTTRVSL